MGDMADLELMNCMDNFGDFTFFCYPPFPIKLDRGPGECPKCKSETILRNGKFGDFYGCTKFPDCKGSRCLR